MSVLRGNGKVTERVSIRAKSVKPAAGGLRENALRAHALVADGLAGRLRGNPDALDSLRERFAPSLTPRGFPRSRVFRDVVREASVAVVCGLAFACSAGDRGLIDSQLAGLPLLARALDDGDGPTGAEQALWRELRTMLTSFHDGIARCRDDAPARDGAPGRRGTNTRSFSPLLCDLPPELELPDGALKNALRHLRGAHARGSEPQALDRAPMAIRSLGDIYEALIGGLNYGNTRKATGTYYTPDVIVRHIVSGALSHLLGDSGVSRAGEPPSAREILDLKILDPASGAGHFLIPAAEYLARACVAVLIREGKIGEEETELTDAIDEYRKIVARRCIYGVDIDPVAVELAGLSLWLYSSDPGVSLSETASHLRCGNSLHRFDWAGEFPAAEQGFDAVIGNPPYLSFSGRQKPGGNKWIKQLDPDSKPGGWQTMHGLFMLKSMELAKRTGLVSMVVPDQVGHLKGYKPLRSRMLEAGRLLEVRYWGEDVFKNVISPALTFIVRRSQETSGGDTKSPRVGQSPEVRDTSADETVLIDSDGNKTIFSPLPGQEWFNSPSRAALSSARVMPIFMRWPTP